MSPRVIAAKWLYHDDRSLSLHTSPLEAADVLRLWLWGTPRAQPVFISATLRETTGFKRLGERVGLPPGSRTLALPYTFPYEKSTLFVPAMKHTPKPFERALFIEECKKALEKVIDPKEGTLVLFPSWAMLKALAPHLRTVYGETNCKVQGELPVRLLVDQHRKVRDAGRGSILMGVATMAEGLDLPGHYCDHVIITALPFAVPSDPVEQELQDILGSKYFSQRSLPDAMMKLTQMVGRLLRRMSDVGRVTILDRRIASTEYGRRMLEALPPFTKDIEPALS